MRSEAEVRRAKEVVVAEYERLCKLDAQVKAAQSGDNILIPGRVREAIHSCAVMHGVLGWMCCDVDESPDHPVNAFTELLGDLEKGGSDGEVSEVGSEDER